MHLVCQIRFQGQPSNYVNENFTVTKLNELCICTEEIEALFVDFIDLNQSITFGVVYRPPDGNIKNFYSMIEYILGKIPTSTNTIFSSDFNIDLLKNNELKSKFENLFFGNCFVPIISL